MSKIDKLAYEEDGGVIWVVMDDGKRYGLCQTSGELSFKNPLSDYYWNDIENGTPDEVRSLFIDIVNAFNLKKGSI